jgi:hypothetical protein
MATSPTCSHSGTSLPVTRRWCSTDTSTTCSASGRSEGITQLVSGAGGHGRYPIDRGERGLAFGNDEDYGALRLELRPGKARYAFVSADGRELDSGRVRCRR